MCVCVYVCVCVHEFVYVYVYVHVYENAYVPGAQLRRHRRHLAR